MSVQIRWCGDCGQDRSFEVPPCQDDHGLDCLDLACLDCGAAVVLGVLWSEPADAPDVVLVAA